MTLADDRRIELAEAGQKPLLTAHADDACTWGLEQAELRREDRLELIDTVNLADEIEGFAHYRADKFRSDLSRILQHLLKSDQQPQMRTRSWFLNIEEHRRRIAQHLEDGPGLKGVPPKLLAEAYRNGRRHALDETGLPQALLPRICPYSWDEIMSRPITWPEET